MSENMSGRLIFAMTALSVFSLVVTLMGGSYGDISGDDYQLIDVPEDIKAGTFWDYNITTYNNGSITDFTTTKFYIPVGSDDYIQCQWQGEPNDQIAIWYAYGKMLWFLKNSESLYPRTIAEYEIINDYNDETNSSTYHMTSKHYEWLVQFSYNQSAYTDIEDAITNDDLYFYIGQGNDLSPARMSAWSLVTSILLWQNPDIHPAVNFIIALPLYSLMAVVFFYVFTRVIEVLKPFG